MVHVRLFPSSSLPVLSALLLVLWSVQPARAEQTPAAAVSATAGRGAEARPASRDAALPRRTPAIALPSLDEMRAAARAETSKSPAGGSAPSAAPDPAVPASQAVRPQPVASPLPSPAPVVSAALATPAAPAGQSAPAVPLPDRDGADPLERLRARLAERLAAVKAPDAASPFELQVSTRADVGAPPPRAVAVGTGPAPPRRATAKKAVDKALGEGEWTYEGDRGPQAWGGLCASGRRQSPIDIRGGLPVALEPIAFSYQAGAFSVLDTGHTVQVNVAPGSHAQLNGRRFELQQFHFHRPSEETLDGRRFDLSVHLVHRDEQGRRLVVAVLVQQGSAQPVLRSVFGHLPLEKRQENQARATLNPAELLPGEQAYYTYMGSMTTPPCSEDVLWVVLRHPVAASAEQIELFGRLYMNNVRPLQQAEGRRILQTR